MGVRSLDLDETLRTDGLITATSSVQERRVVSKADGAILSLFVKVDFDALAVDISIRGQFEFLSGWLGSIGTLAEGRSRYTFGPMSERIRGRWRGN